MMIYDIKRQAHALQKAVRIGKNKPKLSWCYEFLAKLWGYPNWDTLSGLLNQEGQTIIIYKEPETEEEIEVNE